MKVLIYFSGEIDEPKGTPIRVNNFIFQLIKNGADVYYTGRKKPKSIDNIHFLKTHSVVGRIFSIIGFVKKNNIELIYIQTSAGLWLAPLFRIFTKSKISLDYHSLLVEEEKMYKNYGYFNYLLRKKIDYYFSFFLHFATGVSSRLGVYYKRAVPVFMVVPGGVDLTTFNNKILPNKDIVNWKGGSILLGYAGNTKWYQGLDSVLEVLEKLVTNTPNRYKLLIVASSVDDTFIKYINEHKLSKYVKIIDKRPHNEVPSLLIASDVLLIVRPSDMVTEYAYPSKFPEYAALGKVLLVSDVGDIGNYIKNNKNGILIKPKDIDSLYNRLLELSDQSLCNRLGNEAFKLAQETLDNNIIGEKLFKFLYANTKK